MEECYKFSSSSRRYNFDFLIKIKITGTLAFDAIQEEEKSGPISREGINSGAQ